MLHDKIAWGIPLPDRLPGLSAGISDLEDLGQGPGICVFNKYSR